MNLARSLRDVLFESPIDITRPSLDKDLFDDHEEPHPGFIHFLKRIVNEIDEEVTPIVGRAFIKGSILSYQWLPWTDVDLLVEIDDDITDEQWEIIRQDIKDRFGEARIPGTKHPVQVFPQRGKYPDENADGIYDLNRGWVKGPYNIEANVDEYVDQFKQTVQSLDLETGELRRNLIDYHILRSLPEDEQKKVKALIAKEVDEIEQSVRELVYQKEKIKNARHAAFNRPMSPPEIVKYGSKNLLPENITQKMLERYYYMQFLSELDDIMDEKEELSEQDLEELERLFNLDDLYD